MGAELDGLGWGGFGDGAARSKAAQLMPLMSQLAAQAGNGHWQWYVEQMGGPRATGGLIGFVRDKLPPVPPDDLPTSRWFRGTGQAALNTTLTSADEDVQILFKSSPIGTCSHGNAANNSFFSGPTVSGSWSRAAIITCMAGRTIATGFGARVR